jgi:hypothetical protein
MTINIISIIKAMVATFTILFIFNNLWNLLIWFLDDDWKSGFDGWESRIAVYSVAGSTLLLIANLALLLTQI